MKRIVWSKAEKRMVMREMLRIQLHEDSDLTQMELLKKAQAVLPPERQNRAPSYSLASHVTKSLNQLVASGHIQPAEQPAPPPEPPKPAQSTNGTAAAPSATDPCPFVVIEKPVYIKEEPDYGRIPTTTLARILLERLQNIESIEQQFASLKQSLNLHQQEERRYRAPLDTRAPAHKPTPEQRPLHIVVCGLKSEQAQEVELRTKSVAVPIKLTFIEDSVTPTFPTLADHIIVSRFSRHSVWENARHHLDSGHVHFADGAVNPVVQKVFDITSRRNGVINGATHA